MPPIMIFGTIFITLALVFYTIGVWSERIAGRLKVWHVIFFWLGLACDATGTTLMVSYAGSLKADLHGVTGLVAILLMAVNALWATAVLARKDEQGMIIFHRFSLVVWVIWLIPYFSGVFMGMRG
jgi:uncharacterized repeat protein (TIGR03987 family)